MIIMTVVDKNTNELYTKASNDLDAIFNLKPVGEISIRDIVSSVDKITPIVEDKEYIVKFYSENILGSVYTTDVEIFSDILSIFNNR